MWKKANAEGMDGEFLYELEDGNFQTDFFVQGDEAENKKVYLKPTDGKSDGVCLGTLSKGRGGCYLSKSYPVSFLEMNGADFSKSFIICVKKEDDEFMSDPAVKRAENLLNNHPSNQKEKSLSEECQRVMREKMKKFEKISLPFMKDYAFCKIDNIKHPFPLSSIDHVVLTKEFVSVFVKRGEWYVGEKQDCNIFPVAIGRYENEPDPMPLVSDSYCTYTDKDSGIVYHIVGIGVFDDGQYFCKISDFE